VLITDELHPSFLEDLQLLKIDYHYRPEISAQQVAKIIGQYTGLIVSTRIKVTQELIDQGQQLRFIGRAGSGMELIDRAYAESKGIYTFNSPEGNRNAVAEHALGLLLSLMHHIHKASNEVAAGRWLREANRGTELDGKIVSILGYGNTGSAFAQKLKGFEVKVLAFDKYYTGFGSEWVRETTMEQIFREADVLSIHLPLTEETASAVNYEYLNRFQKPIYLINTARGRIINTADLLRTLQEGKVLGAGLDVLENEQLDSLSPEERERFEALTADDRIVTTPHVAGWSHESKKHIATVLLQKMRNFLNTVS